MIHLDFNTNSVNQIKMLTSSGQLILTKAVNPENRLFNLSINDLNPGLYIIIVEGTQMQPEILKFMKK